MLARMEKSMLAMMLKVTASGVINAANEYADKPTKHRKSNLAAKFRGLCDDARRYSDVEQDTKYIDAVTDVQKHLIANFESSDLPVPKAIKDWRA